MNEFESKVQEAVSISRNNSLSRREKYLLMERILQTMDPSEKIYFLTMVSAARHKEIRGGDHYVQSSREDENRTGY